MRRAGAWLGLLLVVGALAFGFVPYLASSDAEQWWCSGPLLGGHLHDPELGDDSLLGPVERDPRDGVCRGLVPRRIEWQLAVGSLGLLIGGAAWRSYRLDPDWEWLGRSAA